MPRSVCATSGWNWVAYRARSRSSNAATGAPGVVAVTVAPGGATAVEFKVDYPGRYILVDHALSRLERGLAGFLIVDGPADKSIFEAGSPAMGAGH